MQFMFFNIAIVKVGKIPEIVRDNRSAPGYGKLNLSFI